MTTKHRIYTTSFASVYPLYVAKAEKKGRTKWEVDAVIFTLHVFNHIDTIMSLVYIVRATQSISHPHYEGDIP